MTEPRSLSSIRSKERLLDTSGLPSTELQHPRLALNLTGSDVGSEDAKTPDSFRRGRKLAKPEVENREEMKLWTHVKSLETQLELLAASHNMQGQSYNSGLTQTLVGLAEHAEPAVGPDSPLLAQHSLALETGQAVEEKKLWNTWDLRLNIGLEVGKWFGHRFQAPSFREEAPYDLGADPNKRAGSSLEYSDINELNRRMATIEQLAALIEKLESDEKNWKGELASIRAAHEPAVRSASRQNTTLSPDLQERLSQQIFGLNRAFLQQVDDLLHQIINVADIWGEKQHVQAELARLSSQVVESTSRVRQEMDARSSITAQTADLAKRMGEEQSRVMELTSQVEQESTARMDALHRCGVLEEELKACKAQLDLITQSFNDAKVQLNEERKQGFQTSERLASASSTVQENERTVENLTRHLDNEKKIRDRLAKETAELQIELGKWREECEVEKNNAFEFQREVDSLKDQIRKMQGEMDQGNEQFTSQMIKLTDIRLKKEELERVNKVLQQELAQSEYTKDLTNQQKETRLDEALRQQSTLQAEVRRLEDRLHDGERKHRDLQAQNELLFKELDDLQNREEVDVVVAELRRLLAQALSEKQSLDHLCTQLRQDMSDVQREQALRDQMHETDVDRLRAQIEAANEENDVLLKKLASTQGAQSELSKKLQERGHAVLQHQMSIEEQNSLIDELKQMIQVLTSEKDVLKTQLVEFEEELEREVHTRAVKTEEASRAERLVDDLKAKLEHEQVIRADLEKGRRKYEEERMTLEAQLSRVTVDQTSTFHSMDELQRECSALRRSRDQIAKHRDDTLEEMQKMQRLLDQMTTERNDLEHKDNELKRQLGVESYQRQENEKKLEEAMREMNTLNGHLTHLKQSKSSMEQQIKHLRDKLEMDSTERLELNVHSSALERQFAKAREEIEELKGQIETHVKTQEKMQSEAETSRHEFEMLQKAHRAQKAQFEQMLRENTELVNDNKGLETEVQRLRKKLQLDVAEKDTLTRAGDAKDAELIAYRKQLDAVMSEKYAGDKELIKMQELIKTYSKDKATFELEKLQLGQELADARKRLGMGETDHLKLMDSWNDDKKRYEKKLIDLEEQHKAALKTLQDDLDAAHLSMQQLITQSQLKYKAYEDEIEHYKHQVHQGLLKEEDMNERCVGLSQANDRMTTDIQSAMTNQERLEDDLQHAKTKLKKLQAQYDAVFQELENAQAELSQNDKARNQVARARDQAERKVDELKAAMIESERKLMEVKKTLRDNEVKITQLSNDNASQALEIQRLQQQVDKESYSSRTAGKDVDELRQQISTLSKDKSSLQLSVEAAQAEVTNYINKVKELLQQISELQLTNQTLQAELDRERKTTGDLTAKSNARKQQIDATETELLGFKKRLTSYLSPAGGSTAAGAGGASGGLAASTQASSPALSARDVSSRPPTLPRSGSALSGAATGSTPTVVPRGTPQTTPGRAGALPPTTSASSLKIEETYFNMASLREYTARGSGIPARTP